MDVAAEPIDHDDLTLLSIPEAVKALRVGPTHFYKLMADGVIHPLRLGRRTLRGEGNPISGPSLLHNAPRIDALA
ncbi:MULTISPECIES: AlpA family transcriptional regulator [Mycobacteriaceae]|uniref:helix-turn-helix transcriptional regulator n=1 Tax=Mycobacteriaceae TaxID=1762 RepID=UPI000769AE6E|nr:helix-turn-helix domain-containing protein [Mycolicibacterium mucogenicum]